MSENGVEGVGQILARARQAKGMSVADVADKLKLTERQIEAIEADELDRLPSPVFARGFVRNYARLVEVPVEDLPGAVQQVSQPTATITAPSEEVVISTSPLRRWLLLPLIGLVLFLVLVALLYNWLRQGEEAYLPSVSTQPVPQAHTVTLPAQAPVPVPVPAQPAVENHPPQASEPKGDAPTSPRSATEPPAPGHAENGTSYEFGDAVSAGHVVQISALDEQSWVSVESSDGRRYSKLLQPGERMTVHGAPPLRVVLGNGAHARLSYDGKPVDVQPHIGEKVARLTLK